MKFSIRDFAKFGKVVRQSDVYTVTDVSKLENLVVSLTELHEGKETSGHSHGDADEVYYFFKGKAGKILPAFVDEYLEAISARGN